jgi:hypothetical protein
MDSHTKTCSYCQDALQAASRLRFKRLGKHERGQLLRAAPPGKPPNPILPPGVSQALQTATRRAIANLARNGLIRISPQTTRLDSQMDEAILKALRRKYAVLRMAWRTELGQEIVVRYSREFERGERIRWTTHLDDCVNAVLDSCPFRSTDN